LGILAVLLDGLERKREADSRSTTMMKLLVLGVDSAVGANLALSWADRHAVCGLFRRQPVALESCSTTRFDPENVAALQALVRRESPGWIVYCGPFGLGSWDIGEEIPDAEAEARLCAGLADAADTLGARLTILSTDAVFNGSRLFHDELSEPAGSDPFAVAARRVEQSVEGRPVLVVRTHAYGWSPLDYEPDCAEQIWQTMAEGRACVLDPRRYATPILATDLAGLLDRAYRIGLSGLYHIAGEERVSEYCFAAALAAAFDLSDYRIEAQERDSSSAQRCLPADTSLATRRAQRDLQCRMPSVREGLERFAAQRTNGWRRRFHAWSRAA
jgi:dTDP-4-dehydrorhamnose reductase